MTQKLLKSYRPGQFTLGEIQLKHTKKEEVSHFQIYLTFLKDPFIFIGQSKLPKCPQEKFEIKIFYYGDLAFFWEFLGDFIANDAKEANG